MQKQTFAWLAGAAGLLVVAAYWGVSGVGRQGGATSAAAALFPGLAAQQERLSEFRLSGKDGQKTALQLKDGRWQVAERGYPADAGKLKALLRFLAEARIVEAKTALPENHGKLGLDEAQAVRVEALAGAEPLARLLVGRAASATRGQFVRRADEAQSYLVDKEFSPGAEPAQWLATGILDLPEAEVQRVEREGAYRLSRTARGGELALSPLPAGQRAAEAYQLAAVSGALANLELSDVHKTPYEIFEQGEKQVSRYYGFDGTVVRATVVKAGEQALLSLEARYDEAQAKAHGGAPDEAKAKAVRDKVAEWQRRLAGWVFTVYGTRGDNIARPLSELVQDPAKAEAGQSR